MKNKPSGIEKIEKWLVEWRDGADKASFVDINDVLAYVRSIPAEEQSSKAPTGDCAGLREELADLEHRRWSSWQKWCHQVLRDNCPSPELEKVLERWDKQIATDYKDLSEREKDMDRKEADKTISILSNTPSTPEAQKPGVDGIDRIGYEWARSNESFLCVWPVGRKEQMVLANHFQEKLILEIERLRHPVTEPPAVDRAGLRGYLNDRIQLCELEQGACERSGKGGMNYWQGQIDLCNDILPKYTPPPKI